ncbi:hypothetical protein Trydic_g6077 [Trypoxylus dichotomus]
MFAKDSESSSVSFPWPARIRLAKDRGNPDGHVHEGNNIVTVKLNVIQLVYIHKTMKCQFLVLTVFLVAVNTRQLRGPPDPDKVAAMARYIIHNTVIGSVQGVAALEVITSVLAASARIGYTTKGIAFSGACPEFA